MTLRLVIESSPSPQTVTERLFDGGQLSIGRGDEADWQLADPKMFVSRRHCILSEEGGRVMVTDASSGGLFIDNAANPVGPGNAVPVEPGMRLHLGDFILRVEAARAAPGTEAPKPRATSKGGFFADEPPAPPPEPTAPRPDTLPDPFGLRSDSAPGARHKEMARPPRPLDQADPFGLDLRSAFDDRPEHEPERDTPPAERPAGGGYFDAAPSSAAPVEPTRPEPNTPGPTKKDIFGSWSSGLDEDDEDEEPTPPPISLVPDPPPRAPVEPDLPVPPVSEPVSAKGPVARNVPPMSSEDGDLRDALLRGMGIDPASLPASDDPVAEMEHLGRCMHDMAEGVMLLLRTRAQEKQKVRVAQTIIASADVNPLKFLATPEDALTALIRPRGRGYLPPDEAVPAAFRDLADHQVRTWSALQIALRRMVDKFDPAEIEKEMSDVGMLESLVAGGRKAKLWQIYADRYRDIAQSAEKQFLGDVGGDFRDAYENKGS
ncbi:type VI secretion system-associated FHA domain protein TagH [Puniceibacterium sp. IMCC21224]|uniref:type VI secretion system-associated FHA domain protein TagH n=1 Tax=Puniceibacterium sp. IMCC21224 TaxID=1618204 RepID=UPI00064DA518|nr:type VI secretion system-associated FHA domain protein TagH [Puniceibacterium sp. IMCC21224]KMK65231.1 FHA domain protein [Puniceibacterium sp. IMCC21224]